MRSIHDRPTGVLSRREIGHWEGDLIIGSTRPAAIATLVERKTRFTILVPLPNGYSATAVAIPPEQDNAAGRSVGNQPSTPSTWPSTDACPPDADSPQQPELHRKLDSPLGGDDDQTLQLVDRLGPTDQHCGPGGQDHPQRFA